MGVPDVASFDLRNVVRDIVESQLGAVRRPIPCWCGPKLPLDVHHTDLSVELLIGCLDSHSKAERDLGPLREHEALKQIRFHAVIGFRCHQVAINSESSEGGAPWEGARTS